MRKYDHLSTYPYVRDAIYIVYGALHHNYA
jgi:hypothetical protein